MRTKKNKQKKDEKNGSGPMLLGIVCAPAGVLTIPAVLESAVKKMKWLVRGDYTHTQR